jgi:transcriptional regulator with XRE-family HTH domain
MHARVRDIRATHQKSLTPVTSSELAKKTGLHERYVREWLSGQAASGYIDYHADKNAFSLSPEQAMAFAEEGLTGFLRGRLRYRSIHLSR